MFSEYRILIFSENPDKLMKFYRDTLGMKLEKKLDIPNDYGYMFQHVNSLSPDHQEVLKLRYWSDMSFGEIASVLNIKETTAKVRHYRAIQQLKTLMEKYEHTT